jgi:hypothetical protein
MKLRIRANSLRLRLLQNEVTALAQNGALSEHISFGASCGLTYKILSSADAKDISAIFNGREILVTVPKAVINEWAGSLQIGISKDQCRDDAGNALKILIEKDFVCLERADDPDNADAFPHPAANC